MTMVNKTKINTDTVNTEPFARDVLATAERIVDAYDIVLRREESEWVGHALEYPEAIGFGKTVQECVAQTRECLIAGVASMLEDGETPPTPARQNVRSEQVNLRLTPEEKALFESRSRTKGFRGVADYLRATALADK